ncbi:hypothetical protein [Aquimarina pacifica]|uniref:hypothetical protein n=1 Tax=Aquimarina pacifica TaxID=1296415 RepID=UPI000470EB7F|nr:hypothetical protein [Aquimarina pacifica]
MKKGTEIEQISLENELRLKLKNGKKARIVLMDSISYREFEANIAKRYPKKNGVERVQLKDGSYAHIIYPESPLYKEIKKMIADHKKGKTVNTISKGLEKLLSATPQKTNDKEKDLSRFKDVQIKRKKKTYQQEGKSTSIHQTRSKMPSFANFSGNDPGDTVSKPIQRKSNNKERTSQHEKSSYSKKSGRSRSPLF